MIIPLSHHYIIPHQKENNHMNIPIDAQIAFQKVQHIKGKFKVN